MKYRLLHLLFTCSALSFSTALLADTPPWLQQGGGLEEGATLEEVIEILGEPTGSLGSESVQIYHFDRGEVTFRNGRLVSHSLISEEEARERREKAEARREQLRREREEEREQRIAKGREIKGQYLSDPAFADHSPRARLAFWQRFQQHYPEIDVDLQITLARAEAREWERERRAEIERDRRLAQAEARVAEAEARAREAERREQAVRREGPTYRESVVYVQPRRDRDRRKHGRGKTDEPRETRIINIQPSPPVLPSQRPESPDAYAFPRDPNDSSPYPFTRNTNDTGTAYPFSGNKRQR